MRSLDVIAGAAFAALLVLPCAAQESALRDSASIIIDGPRAAAADSALRAQEAQGFAGVVLVEAGGRVILRKGYGLAVRKPPRPFAPSTVVQIGSNTKDFTAVAILQLAAKGALALTDSLGKFFAGVPADKRGITVQELLEHRSGLPLYSGLDFDSVTRAQFLGRVMALPLRFPPGTDRAYSNAGYSVLAAIIEVVTGDSYGAYCDAHLWRPLGMHDTGLLLAKFDTLRLAHGYQGDEDAGTMLDKPHAADGPYWNLRGNGGFLSTVTDMWHFYDVLFGSSALLPAAQRDVMFPPDRPVAHAGSDMISFFLYERAPREGVVLIMATNQSDFPAPRAREAIAPLLGLPPMGGRGGQRVGGPPPGNAPFSLSMAVALPATPAGRQAAAFIAMFNAGDTAAARQFMATQEVQDPGDHRTMDQRVSSYRGMRHQVGAMVPVAVISSEPTQIVLRMRTEHGESPTLTVTVEAAAPNRITGLRIAAGE
ncbi:MAG TPA: serine hydrolase domain-containing protein [Gemmatimonadaceae bacterium]|nr:serine hydrolase domain-containing protein [Gemmatimonadaceae bacterium]